MVTLRPVAEARRHFSTADCSGPDIRCAVSQRCGREKVGKGKVGGGSVGRRREAPEPGEVGKVDKIINLCSTINFVFVNHAIIVQDIDCLCSN